jgi:predicted transcriptional regulator
VVGGVLAYIGRFQTAVGGGCLRAALEEILQEIVIARMVDRGLADVDAGRGITDEEMRRTVDSWDEE